MSGSRNGVIQHLRTVTPNNPPANNTMFEGELSVELGEPMRLWVGVPVTLDPTGRKLLYDKSSSGGAIVSVVHDPSLIGDGTSVSPLMVTQATQAQLGGLRIALSAEITAGTVDSTAITPLGLRQLVGSDVSALVTDAKTIVPAINEIINDLEQVLGLLVFAGAYDAATSTGAYNGQAGIPQGTGPLPASTASNRGAYLINVTDGAGVGANEPGAPLHPHDWMVSDGVAWAVLHFHQPQAVAGDIAVIPPVPDPSGTNVQIALEQIYALAAAPPTLYFATPTFVGNAITPGAPLDIGVIDAGTY
jgi:hypothetical protein